MKQSTITGDSMVKICDNLSMLLFDKPSRYIYGRAQNVQVGKLRDVSVTVEIPSHLMVMRGRNPPEFRINKHGVKMSLLGDVCKMVSLAQRSGVDIRVVSRG